MISTCDRLPEKAIPSKRVGGGTHHNYKFFILNGAKKTQEKLGEAEVCSQNDRSYKALQFHHPNALNWNTIQSKPILPS